MASGTASARAVMTIRAAPASANWYTRVADKTSRWCASSTTSEQIALLLVTAQRGPGRPQQRGRLPDVGDLHQMAEGPERDHAFGGGAGDPAGNCGGVLADELFGS